MLKVNGDGMYVCAECQKPFGTVRALSTHIGKCHGSDAKTYYDVYLKEAGEGTCPVCGKPTKFRSLGEGYKVCCSHACFGKHFSADTEKVKARNAKSEATSMARYGVKNAGGTKEALEKAQQTNLARRGVRWNMQSSAVVEKSRETCVEKYGATTYVHSQEGSDRVTDTVRERFGRDNFFSGPEGLAAAREGMVARHGVENPMFSREIIEARSAAEREKYGGKLFVQTDEFKEKSRETQVERYGTWYSASPEGRKAYRDAILEKYGDAEYFQTDDFKQKNQATLHDTYGVTNYSQTPEWKDKVKATSESRYGVSHPSQSPVVKAKGIATCMERYGVENFAKTPEFVERATKTSLEHWGVSHPSRSPIIGERRIASNMLKYGAPHYMQSAAYQDRILGRYISLIEGKSCEIVDRPTPDTIKFRCKICGNEMTEQVQLVKARSAAGLTPCTCCMPKNPPVSYEERELTAYVESLGFTVSHYDRDFIGPYGADIVVEDKKLIIEYDGVYWHSEAHKSDKYHITKTLYGQEKGYRVVHIFSDEWVYSNDIVKSRIKHILGVSSARVVHARDCEVKLVESAIANAFLTTNHLQGAAISKWRYGLYFGEELVALMTFGESRFEDNTIELIRYCALMDVSVVGGAGKLFKRFAGDNPNVEVITSYADARWSTSDAFYTKLGFALDSMSSPGYYIVDGDIRRNRMQFQRHKIAGPGDEGKTEHDITRERGLFRIYDCGQYKYVWRRNPVNQTKEANDG